MKGTTSVPCAVFDGDGRKGPAIATAKCRAILVSTQVSKQVSNQAIV